MQSRNQFLEIVAVGERYLIINDAQNKESKRQPFRIHSPVKLVDGRMSIDLEKISSTLIYNIFSLSKMTGKIEPLPLKII